MAVATLYLLVGVGLYASLATAYASFTGFAPCKAVSVVPLCYLVVAGYAAMLYGLLFNRKPLSSPLFVTGWGLVFAVAAGAVYAELRSPGACSAAGGGISACLLPMAMAMAIIVLYIGLWEHRAGVE